MNFAEGMIPAQPLSRTAWLATHGGSSRAPLFWTKRVQPVHLGVSGAGL